MSGRKNLQTKKERSVVDMEKNTKVLRFTHEENGGVRVEI